MGQASNLFGYTLVATGQSMALSIAGVMLAPTSSELLWAAAMVGTE
jgi:hypothetical protein